MKKLILGCLLAFISFHASAMENNSSSDDAENTDLEIRVQKCQKAIEKGNYNKLKKHVSKITSTSVPSSPAPKKKRKAAKSTESQERDESSTPAEILSSGSSSISQDQLSKLLKVAADRVMRKQHDHDNTSDSWYKRIRKRGAAGIALTIVALIEGYNIIQNNSSSDTSDSNTTTETSSSFGISTQTLTALGAAGSGIYQIWHDQTNKDEESSLYKALVMQNEIRDMAEKLGIDIKKS